MPLIRLVTLGTFPPEGKALKEKNSPGGVFYTNSLYIAGASDLLAVSLTCSTSTFSLR